MLRSSPYGGTAYMTNSHLRLLWRHARPEPSVQVRPGSTEHVSTRIPRHALDMFKICMGIGNF